MKLYCFAPQAGAARTLLESAGIRLATPLHTFRDQFGLMGVSGGALVVVDNHPQKIPPSAELAAERAGMLWFCLSDEWARERMRK